MNGKLGRSGARGRGPKRNLRENTRSPTPNGKENAVAQFGWLRLRPSCHRKGEKSGKVRKRESYWLPKKRRK